MYVKREQDIIELKRRMDLFPITAILGSRQCGKTTLAQKLNLDHYFDLENPRDLKKFENPQLLLEDLQGTIVIDEIQHKPELFPLLRYLVDANTHQKYCILGSASRELINKSSESLAGRIGYYLLKGFSLEDAGTENMNDLWIKGGYPRSYLTDSIEESILWRENYISTFLERDIPQLGINIPSASLRRFWIMLSHYHGQVVNYSELGRSFGASDVTVKHYIDILTGTFMVRLLMPWYANVKKRMVKRPKLYVTDSGIFHSLQSIDTMEHLMSHNKLGASWEGFALEMTIRVLNVNENNIYFWSTHSGAEVDLFWQREGKNFGAEFKYTDVPSVTKSMYSSITDLNISHLWVIYPGKEKIRLKENITAIPLAGIYHELR